ncbi:MAG: very short patch repair endonuclease [Bacteroidetes bacterium GWC2_33_15]|nr:MAG: very short patch repair endonuclease [Bacteroidetes bacterium GWA2_33_15]OFX50607.1 MAG: very short patch repair endonuclease [Bacteroidetes bacterium GWC2_33_15]OFX64144.1 MAG: very short patch repair endonuclease [Bacteroidetes bacterium GWB2_32_14]OFX69756.1 MAG: very short patch repair endonuclease [Bacteroidetes bacterium GWD2_33_33]HAN19793.1 very short patch repair endonuclease [Bacteroidales bacterium]
MTDVHSKKVRSFNMSMIKGKNTKPEMIVRKFLFAHGFRFRINDNKLLGKPDIVLPKYKTAIFVNGCFWHGHTNCKYSKIPRTRKEWWKNKIEATRKRDFKNYEALVINNWDVKIIWECELKTNNKQLTLDNLLLNLLSKN